MDSDDSALATMFFLFSGIVCLGLGTVNAGKVWQIDFLLTDSLKKELPKPAHSLQNLSECASVGRISSPMAGFVATARKRQARRIEREVPARRETITVLRLLGLLGHGGIASEGRMRENGRMPFQFGPIKRKQRPDPNVK